MGVFHALRSFKKSRVPFLSTCTCVFLIVSVSFFFTMAPYLGLRGMPLVMAVTTACSTGFLLFGIFPFFRNGKTLANTFARHQVMTMVSFQASPRILFFSRLWAIRAPVF